MQASDVRAKIVALMTKQKLKRIELAKRLGMHRAQVSMTLNDPNNNWTVDNLDRWARALGYRIEIKFVKLPKEDQTQ